MKRGISTKIRNHFLRWTKRHLAVHVKGTKLVWRDINGTTLLQLTEKEKKERKKKILPVFSWTVRSKKQMVFGVVKEWDTTFFRGGQSCGVSAGPLPVTRRQRLKGVPAHKYKCCSLHCPFYPRGESLLPLTYSNPAFLVLLLSTYSPQKPRAGKFSLNDANKNSLLTVNAWLHTFPLISKHFQYVLASLH